MAWDASSNAGFSTAEPWLPLHDDWPTRNVAAEKQDPGSLLSLTHALLALRRAEPALSVGNYLPVASSNNLLAYTRRASGARILVALNLGPDPMAMPEAARGGERLLSTLAGEGDPRTLRGNEGVILRLPA